MKKKTGFLFPSVIAVLIALIAAVLVIFSDDFLQNPFDNRLDFHFPYKCYIDDENSLYLIDYNNQGYTRLVKIDARGRVVFSLNGGGRGESQIYTVYSLALDESNHIYLINLVPNIEDGFYETEEIKHFSPSGKYMETIVRYSYDEEQRRARQDFPNADLAGVKAAGGNLYYFAADSEGFYGVYRTSIVDKATERLFTLPTDQILGDQIGHEIGKIYLNLNDGNISTLSEENGVLKIEAEGFSNQADYPDLNPYPFQIAHGVLYFNELFSQTIMKVENRRLVPVLNIHDSLKGTYPFPNTLVQYFSINDRGFIAAPEKNHKRILVFGPDGKPSAVLEYAVYPLPAVALRICLWALALAGLVLLVLLIYLTYARLFKRRVSLIVKNAFVFTPIIILGLILTSTIIYNRISDYYMDKLKDEFYVLAQLGASRIRGENLSPLHSLKDIASDSYDELKKEMNGIVNGNQDKWNEGLSVYLYKEINGVFYISDSVGYDFLYPYTVPDAYYEVLRTGVIQVVRYFDETGEWMAGVAPIKDDAGRTVGLLEVSKEMNVARETENLFAQNLFFGSVVSVVVFMLIFIIITVFLLLSVRKLKRMVNEIINKNYDVEIAIKSRDEMEDLGNGFNFMAREIKDHILAIQNLNKANQKFVPGEFLKLLGKENITYVNLGDQTASEMTVMFADIRNFTTISEKMSPKENFNFLNSYLSRMGPIIRNNRGFIDKYIGDAIMALFPVRPDDAVRTAVEMQFQLREYNMHRANSGYEPISIGSGIHTGKLMLGIIGEIERFDGTVISDAVNLSSRLEGMNKTYQTSILASGETLKALADKKAYHFRFVDRICVKGKTIPISIYEIYDGDSEEQIQKKDETKAQLLAALRSFFAQRYQEALSLFRTIREKNPEDLLVDFYIARTKKLMRVAGLQIN